MESSEKKMTTQGLVKKGRTVIVVHWRGLSLPRQSKEQFPGASRTFARYRVGEPSFEVFQVKQGRPWCATIRMHGRVWNAEGITAIAALDEALERHRACAEGYLDTVKRIDLFRWGKGASDGS